MQYNDALNKLKASPLPQAYLLAGTEDYLADRFLAQLFAKILPNGDRSLINELTDPSFAALEGACHAISFFDPLNIIMLRQEKFPEEKKLPQLLEQLDQQTFLIWRCHKLDKRQALYKNFQKFGLVVELTPLRPYQADSWLQQKLREINKSLTPAAHNYLIAALSILPQLPLSFLDQEFEKLRFFVAGPRIDREHLEASFSSLPEISSFAFAEAIGNKDVALALQLLERQQQEGTKLPTLLAILVRQLHTLWEIKNCRAARLSARTIAQQLKLHPFIAEKLTKQADHFTLEALHEAIIELSEIDYAFKSGQIKTFALEDLTIRLCRSNA